MSKQRDYVFVGPSFPSDHVADILPRAVVLPPIQLGDLLNLDVRPGDRVLIIDGLFMHSPAVRHREILHLLERGTVVAGSSSMGALRAAELWSFGMRGFGDVFGLYRDGEVTGDDEVAIVHGPAEAGYRALSEPLVNIRLALRAAVADGAVDAKEADRLLASMAGLPFRSRSYRAMDALARAAGEADAAGRFGLWRRDHATDAKHADAITLLRAAAADDPRLAPAGHPDRPIQHVETTYFGAWRSAFHGDAIDGMWFSDAQVAGAIALLHPEYPRLHRNDVVRRVRRLLETDTADDSIDPGDEENQLVTTALERGIVPPGIPDESGLWGWLAPSERSSLTPLAAAGVLLGRMYGTVTAENIGLSLLPPALQDQATQHTVRRILAMAVRYARSAAVSLATRSAGIWGGDSGSDGDEDRKDRATLAPITFRREITHQVFCRLWNCPPEDLEKQAWDRGLADLKTLAEVAQPLMPFLRVFGDPGISWGTTPVRGGDAHRSTATATSPGRT